MSSWNQPSRASPRCIIVDTIVLLFTQAWDDHGQAVYVPHEKSNSTSSQRRPGSRNSKIRATIKLQSLSRLQPVNLPTVPQVSLTPQPPGTCYRALCRRPRGRKPIGKNRKPIFAATTDATTTAAGVPKNALPLCPFLSQGPLEEGNPQR